MITLKLYFPIAIPYKTDANGIAANPKAILLTNFFLSCKKTLEYDDEKYRTTPLNILTISSPNKTINAINLGAIDKVINPKADIIG